MLDNFTLILVILIRFMSIESDKFSYYTNLQENLSAQTSFLLFQRQKELWCNLILFNLHTDFRST